MTLEAFKSKKIGVTILGGGMRATAYIGMLKAFEEFGINIHAIIGSSGGAVVGASYAFGNSPEKILKHFESFNPLTIFNPIRIARSRGIDYSPWEEHAAKLVPVNSNIEDAKINLAIKAVDIDTSDSVYLTTGSVVKAVIASSAVVDVYKYKGSKYIDGDYDPETGVEQLKILGAELTMLCLISTPAEFSFVNLQITQKNALKSDIELHRPDFILNIPLKSGWMLSKKSVNMNFQEGYDATRKFLEHLEEY